MQPNLSIIIPMYNEENRINSLISNLEDFKNNFNNRVDVGIIFVGDGTTDLTLRKVQKYKSTFY